MIGTTCWTSVNESFAYFSVSPVYFTFHSDGSLKKFFLCVVGFGGSFGFCVVFFLFVFG